MYHIYYLKNNMDFIDKEMSTIVSPTIDFYSDDTIKRRFDVIEALGFPDDNIVILLSKDRKFASIGIVGIRREDKKSGVNVVGRIEFKDSLNISYDRDVKLENALQVDYVEIKPVYKEQGYGYLLYFNLAFDGNIIVSDNVQYIGGKELWKKIAKFSKFENYNVYIYDNGFIVNDSEGNPKKYDGINIDDADIWAPKTLDINKSKRYVLLILRK